MTTLYIADLLADIAAAADEARAATQHEPWREKLQTGYSWLIDQDAIEYDLLGHVLTLTSPNTGNTYRVSAMCECEAGRNARLCWHRGAAHIARKALWRQGRRRRVYDDIDELFA
jgi:hypothetical protein